MFFFKYLEIKRFIFTFLFYLFICSGYDLSKIMVNMLEVFFSSISTIILILNIKFTNVGEAYYHVCLNTYLILIDPNNISINIHS